MRHTDFTKTSRSLFASALLVPLLLPGCGTPEQKEKPATVELSNDFIRGVDRQMTLQPFEDQARRAALDAEHARLMALDTEASQRVGYHCKRHLRV